MGKEINKCSLTLILCLLMAWVLACGRNSTPLSDNRTGTIQPTVTPDEIQGDAMGIVALDIGSRPEADDIRVKRVRFLLESLSKMSDAPTLQIAASTDAAVEQVRERYGRDLTRQLLLEQMNTFYRANGKTIKKAQQPYSDVVRAYTVMQYSR